ncbi:hypothetical protein L227DRAFT_299508 [Lentinus tigrinus ALCF2SS1-6]|uniref:Uncharacterized protein n=1 Tax=Lentinus tigrinus ALCF2SS1-6 TaxID=1328759 RepID=A0A5C2RXI0_9APHY|nr:hypothetical protein L227DRAFT_299508 [Lentinus tigrinus ALCF2SS1-6]
MLGFPLVMRSSSCSAALLSATSLYSSHHLLSQDATGRYLSPPGTPTPQHSSPRRPQPPSHPAARESQVGLATLFRHGGTQRWQARSLARWHSKWHFVAFGPPTSSARGFFRSSPMSGEIPQSTDAMVSCPCPWVLHIEVSTRQTCRATRLRRSESP